MRRNKFKRKINKFGEGGTKSAKKRRRVALCKLMAILRKRKDFPSTTKCLSFPIRFSLRQNLKVSVAGESYHLVLQCQYS
jgi:hypothetical protein